MFNTDYQKEIDSIKPREITLKLSDADVERLFKKAASVGLSVSELFENFVGDLVGGTHSNGSDERMYANEWFDRCYFSHSDEKSFLSYLLESHKVERVIDLCKWRIFDIKQLESERSLANSDLDIICELEDSISQHTQELSELFNDFGGNSDDLERECEKVLAWYHYMEGMKAGKVEE